MNAINRGAYALYLGGGDYVGSLSRGSDGQTTITKADQSRAATMGRRAAIEACHQARRAGVMTWVTAAPVAQGVAA